MTINTLDQLIAAQSQRVSLHKLTQLASVAAVPWTLFGQPGNPGAGVLAGTSTTDGVVPVAGNTGFPTINAFGSGNAGYLAKIDYGNTVASRLSLFDLLWKGGAYAFNANTSYATPASFASRVLGGVDFTNTELWYEQVTAATGIQSVNVTYINQAGAPGSSTGVRSQGTAGTIGRMMQLPLQPGDTGVQGVTGVFGSVATAGTFNILVMRRLWSGRVRVANDGDVHDMLKTGLVQVFPDTALYLVVTSDGSGTGAPELTIEIVNG